jgi:hypothetical protein
MGGTLPFLIGQAGTPTTISPYRRQVQTLIIGDRAVVGANAMVPLNVNGSVSNLLIVYLGRSL